MDDTSARKAAKNEAITRSLNEGLAKGEDRWPSKNPTFICECSDLSCTQELHVSLELYRAVREYDTRFLLKTDHMNPEIELEVERNDGYMVVEKIGPGKEVARELS